MQNIENDWGIKITWEWTFTITDKDWKVRKIRKKNLIPSVWKQAFAQQIAWDNTTQIGDNLYIALWTSTTAPNVWDTILGTETQRKAAWDTYASWWQAVISVLFWASEVSGTYKEFWLFWDWDSSTASASANTWILFSHVSADVTVWALETLLVEFNITFS